jgi:hypothetical protein
MNENKYLAALEKWMPDSTSDSAGFPLLRLNEGSYKVRILDESPVCRYVHFESMGKKPVICPGNDCLFCNRGDSKTLRIYTNVLDRSDNKVKVMVYSRALVGYIDRDGNAKDGLAALMKIAGDARLYDITIVRTGKSKDDTRYQVAKTGEIGALTEKITTYDLDELLKPMPATEQMTHLREKSQAVSRKIREFTPNEDVVSSLKEDAIPISDGEAPI